MDRLYALALLLTVDHKLAEECFVTGLGDCLSTALCVFRQWVLTWSKRMVIKNAIRVIAPTAEKNRRPLVGYSLQLTSPVSQAIVELGGLSRFAFVMSVLERYSVRDCTLLLNCTLQELAGTRRSSCWRAAAACRSSGARSH